MNESKIHIRNPHYENIDVTMCGRGSHLAIKSHIDYMRSKVKENYCKDCIKAWNHRFPQAKIS